MDAAKLNDALDESGENFSLAVRVFRHGCLVAADPMEATNRNEKYESWSMAKSVTSLMFGRADRVGPDKPRDPVGSLLPVADRGHGAITMRHLLTMTSGLHWNGLRDYNVFTGFDRVHDALTLGIDHRPGTYFEYAQSPVSLLAEAIGRSAGMDAGGVCTEGASLPRSASSPAPGAGRGTMRAISAASTGCRCGTEDYARMGELMRPRRRVEGQAAAVKDLHARLDHADEDERLLRLSDLAQPRRAVRAHRHITERPVDDPSASSPTCPRTCTASRACSASWSPCSRRRESWWPATARTRACCPPAAASWEHHALPQGAGRGDRPEDSRLPTPPGQRRPEGED